MQGTMSTAGDKVLGAEKPGTYALPWDLQHSAVSV